MRKRAVRVRSVVTQVVEACTSGCGWCSGEPSHISSSRMLGMSEEERRRRSWRRLHLSWRTEGSC